MLLVPVADFLERQIAQQLGTDDLRAPTALRESWGSGTRRHAQSAWIEEQLVRCGWRSAAALAGLGRELPEVARRINKSVSHPQAYFGDLDVLWRADASRRRPAPPSAACLR